MTTAALSPDAIRRHYKKYGLALIVDNTHYGDATADELYRHADALDEHHPDRAEKIYLACLRKDPRHVLARISLGTLYHKKRDYEAAEAAWLIALEHDPTRAEAHYNLGYLALERGQPLVALNRFRNALEMDPTYEDGWFNLGVAASELNDFREAARAFKEYLQLAPNGYWADLARGYVEGLAEKTKKKGKKKR
jgi:tetratricopeptide (TPR) repeat protein